MIVDGKAIAESIYSDLAPKFVALNRTIKLGIVVIGDNPVIESFVRIKKRAAERLGIMMVRKDLPVTSSEQDIVSAIHSLSQKVDGVIAQLPLPQGIDVDAVLSSIPYERDIDALNPSIAEEDRPVHAPVALAVVDILKRNDVRIEGAKTVVAGAGRLVGAPSAWLLRKMGADVSVFTLDRGSIKDLKEADIVVLGTGNPGFVKPEHIKNGVALVDAGTSELDKKITGDADPACAAKARMFTPVPGGVGPVAVAMIFRNLLALIPRKAKKRPAGSSSRPRI